MLVLIAVLSCVVCVLLLLTLAWTITNVSKLSKSKASSQDVDLLLDHFNGLSRTVREDRRHNGGGDKRLRKRGRRHNDGGYKRGKRDKRDRRDRRLAGLAGQLRSNEDEIAQSNAASAAMASVVKDTTEDVDIMRSTLWDTAHSLDHVRNEAGAARQELSTIKQSLSPYIFGGEWAGWELNAEGGYSQAPEFRASRVTITSPHGAATRTLRVDPVSGALKLCDPDARRCSRVLTTDTALPVAPVPPRKAAVPPRKAAVPPRKAVRRRKAAVPPRKAAVPPRKAAAVSPCNAAAAAVRDCKAAAVRSGKAAVVRSCKAAAALSCKASAAAPPVKAAVAAAAAAVVAAVPPPMLQPPAGYGGMPYGGGYGGAPLPAAVAIAPDRSHASVKDAYFMNVLSATAPDTIRSNTWSISMSVRPETSSATASRLLNFRVNESSFLLRVPGPGTSNETVQIGGADAAASAGAVR
jgi:hypothetical protein